MANSYFQFKEFRIDQDRCAMKVSTEACILGACIPSLNPKRILDIGTGTGLLALMLAQRSGIKIDAVEIDKEAYLQACSNVVQSTWKERINVFHNDIFDFGQKRAGHYDLIVCNPPFFSTSLKSSDLDKNQAKHETGAFDQGRFAQILKDLLSGSGSAFILYPEREAQYFQVEAAKCGLNISRHLIIRNQPEGAIFRLVLKVSNGEPETACSDLSIRNGYAYSKGFEELLKPYYLKFQPSITKTIRTNQ